MPGTVDDFMNRFGGGGTIDDTQAQHYHDRFVLRIPTTAISTTRPTTKAPQNI
jgi:hypothetical protein